MSETHYCPRCKSDKPLDQWSHWHRKSDGKLRFNPYCKSCAVEYVMARRPRKPRAVVPEEVKRANAEARSQRWYAKNKSRMTEEAREKARAPKELLMRWCLECGEPIPIDKRLDAKYCCKEHSIAWGRRKWAQENPEKLRAAQRKYDAAVDPLTRQMRHARRRQLIREGFVENVSSAVVLELDDGQCGICGKDVDPFDFHVDHIIPLARGGQHSYANAQVAHPRCNQSKNSRLPEEVV